MGEHQHDEILLLRDAVRALRADRDSLRADLSEALRLVAPDVPTMDWDWCKRRGALVAKHKDLLRDADRRAETERIVGAGSLPQHLADAENPLHWFHQWHDDDGAVLWFFCPVTEPPFHVGTPFDSDWPWERGREPQQELIWCQLPKLTVDRPAGRGDHHG